MTVVIRRFLGNYKFGYFFFEKPTKTTALPRLLLIPFNCCYCTTDANYCIDIGKLFTIWSIVADYEESTGGFKPIRNRETF